MTLPLTVAAKVPADVLGNATVAVPASTPPTVTVGVPRTVSARRARGRARKQAPQRVFAAELEAGRAPSLREVKRQMRRGTDRARVIRDQLADILQEAPEAA